MPVEIRWAPWALALLLCGCLSGSGSDTETALSGKLVDGNGRGVAGARVLFVPVDNNPLSDSAGGAFPEAKTDAKGVYRFDSLAPGVYNVFGEGMAIAKGRLFVITWKERRALVYDPFSFARLGRYDYAGEGSGLAYNGRHIVMSNLTSTIRFRDPDTFKSVRSIQVKENGVAVDQINALAWIRGQIWANIWLVPDILIIDPATGNVVRRLDFSALQASENAMGNAHDMNGIGYWGNEDRLFVTGKFWQRVYEIEVLPN